MGVIWAKLLNRNYNHLNWNMLSTRQIYLFNKIGTKHTYLLIIGA